MERGELGETKCDLIKRNTFRLMNVVDLCSAWLVPRWVTFFGRVNHLSTEPGTQAYSDSPPSWITSAVQTCKKILQICDIYLDAMEV